MVRLTINKNYMSKETKATVIDLDGAMLMLKSRGIKTSKAAVSDTHSVSVPTLMLWGTEAPVTVSLMNYCLKHSKKDFPQIMKNIKGKDKALDFILDFCNETGLTFQELVKEV